MPDHGCASVFFDFACLTTSLRPPFSAAYVWMLIFLYCARAIFYPWARVRLPLLHVWSWAPASRFLLFLTMSRRLSFSIAYIWLWAVFFYFICLTTSAHLYFSISYVWPQARAHPYFSTSYVWPQARTCIFLFHMSDHKRAPVFFYFVYPGTNMGPSFSIVHVWSGGCARLFLLHASEHEHTLAFFYRMCLITTRLFLLVFDCMSDSAWSTAHPSFFISYIWLWVCLRVCHLSFSIVHIYPWGRIRLLIRFQEWPLIF
jgi:hypothetical protein